MESKAIFNQYTDNYYRNYSNDWARDPITVHILYVGHANSVHICVNS